VVLVGQGSHFEVWDGELWEQKLADALSMAGTTPPPGTENFSL
jgi:DNA-binding transcriptional regulator/RsmH inhibitor MraZ